MLHTCRCIVFNCLSVGEFRFYLNSNFDLFRNRKERENRKKTQNKTQTQTQPKPPSQAQPARHSGLPSRSAQPAPSLPWPSLAARLSPARPSKILGPLPPALGPPTPACSGATPAPAPPASAPCPLSRASPLSSPTDGLAPPGSTFFPAVTPAPPFRSAATPLSRGPAPHRARARDPPASHTAPFFPLEASLVAGSHRSRSAIRFPREQSCPRSPRHTSTRHGRPRTPDPSLSGP